MNNPAVLHAIITELTCFNELRTWRRLAYLNFRVTEAWEGTETGTGIHFKLHTFCIFHILAHAVAFVPFLYIFDTMQAKKFHTLHTNEFNSGICIETPTQQGRTIVGWIQKKNSWTCLRRKEIGWTVGKFKWLVLVWQCHTSLTKQICNVGQIHTHTHTNTLPLAVDKSGYCTLASINLIHGIRLCIVYRDRSIFPPDSSFVQVRLKQGHVNFTTLC